MGGISQDDALQAAGPGAALAEYAAALAETGGRRWLAAPGCSIPPGTPAGESARRAGRGGVHAAADFIGETIER